MDKRSTSNNKRQKVIKYYSGDYVIPINSAPISGGVVAIDGDGFVRGVYGEKDEEIVDKPIVRLKGALLPGFVNAHCHLELSHMKDHIAKGGGLVNFLSTVMTQRGACTEDVLQAMVQADQRMYDLGIQAVGDHANTNISAVIKNESKIHYHTFVEMLGMDDRIDEQVKINQAIDTAASFPIGYSSITLHAPYSCSKRLFNTFKINLNPPQTISIHNQESEEENKLFYHREGDFLRFYEQHGINIADFEKTGRSSVQSYLDWLPGDARLILVHNSHTSASDIDFLGHSGRSVFFCLCPQSNRYIEGQLPPVTDFVWAGVKIVLGTDSLASNSTLDILAELKVIHAAFPQLKLTDTLTWATINGAEALGLDQQIGSLEAGKKPGLVLLKNLDGLSLTKQSAVQRIV